MHLVHVPDNLGINCWHSQHDLIATHPQRVIFQVDHICLPLHSEANLNWHVAPGPGWSTIYVDWLPWIQKIVQTYAGIHAPCKLAKRWCWQNGYIKPWHTTAGWPIVCSIHWLSSTSWWRFIQPYMAVTMPPGTCAEEYPYQYQQQ